MGIGERLSMLPAKQSPLLPIKYPIHVLTTSELDFEVNLVGVCVVGTLDLAGGMSLASLGFGWLRISILGRLITVRAGESPSRPWCTLILWCGLLGVCLSGWISGLPPILLRVAQQHRHVEGGWVWYWVVREADLLRLKKWGLWTSGDWLVALNQENPKQLKVEDCMVASVKPPDGKNDNSFPTGTGRGRLYQPRSRDTGIRRSVFLDKSSIRKDLRDYLSILSFWFYIIPFSGCWFQILMRPHGFGKLQKGNFALSFATEASFSFSKWKVLNPVLVGLWRGGVLSTHTATTRITRRLGGSRVSKRILPRYQGSVARTSRLMVFITVLSVYVTA